MAWNVARIILGRNLTVKLGQNLTIKMAIIGPEPNLTADNDILHH